MQSRSSALRLVPALGLLAAILLVPTESRATSLACDVAPIVIANTSTTVWAYHLDTNEVVWDHALTVDSGSVPPFGDIGQDDAGRIFLIRLDYNAPEIWRLTGASGSADDDPGSGVIALVGTLELPAPGATSAERVAVNMLGFDKYGKGYVVGLDDSSPARSVELLRFDPDVVDDDGTIALEVVTDELEIDGIARRAPAGDILIAGGEAYIPLGGTDDEILAISLTDNGTAYSASGTVRIAGNYASFPGPGSLTGWGTAGTDGRFLIAGNDGSDPAIVEFALDAGSSTFGTPIAPGASGGGILGLTGNGEAVFDACFAGFPPSLGGAESVSSSGQSASTSPVEAATPVRRGGEFPTEPTGGATWNRGGTMTPLTATSSSERAVTYGDADTGVRVTVTGSRGTSIATGVVAEVDGELVCEACADLPVGSVIEVWMFSEPRLVAAHRVTDDDCQTFTIPLATPLDGRGTVVTGSYTLQVALPTAAGMEAVDIGITVGGPVPATVPAGEGAAPATWPVALLLGVAVTLGLAATAQRAVTIRS